MTVKTYLAPGTGLERKKYDQSIRQQLTRALVMTEYTVATVPDAAELPRQWIYVSDEAGGAVPAFSDGTNWRRVTDRAIIS